MAIAKDELRGFFVAKVSRRFGGGNVIKLFEHRMLRRSRGLEVVNLGGVGKNSNFRRAREIGGS